MNLDYVICNILTKKEVSHLREKLDKSKDWSDGGESTIGHDIDIKNNEEQYRSDPKNEIFKYRQSIGNRYLDLEEPYKFTTAKSVTLPIISQMKKGGFYKPHMDEPLLGQYSTTLFLSEPDEYEGGELLLHIGGSTKKVKLSAGKAIIYKSGTPHCVNEVLNGKRIVSVCWIKSLITNQYDRELIYMLRVLGQQLNNKYGDFNDGCQKKYWHTLDSAMSDPYFILKNISHYIESKYPNPETRYLQEGEPGFYLK